MPQPLHPDMDVIREAQKFASTGTTIAEQRAAWSAYAAAFAVPHPTGLRIEDRVLPTPVMPSRSASIATRTPPAPPSSASTTG